MSLIEELMQGALGADDDRKRSALKVLKGEATIGDPDARPARPITGPMLMGVGAAAKLMGISRGTMWRILQAGLIEKVELFPGSYRLRRSDIEDLIEGRSRKKAGRETETTNRKGDGYGSTGTTSK